jgi:hypothetical protein
MHSGRTATWASVSRPGLAGIRPAADDMAHARRARSWHGDHARDGMVVRSPAAQWRLAGGNVLSASTSGTPGWRRARRRLVGLTEDGGVAQAASGDRGEL